MGGKELYHTAIQKGRIPSKLVEYLAGFPETTAQTMPKGEEGTFMSTPHIPEWEFKRVPTAYEVKVCERSQQNNNKKPQTKKNDKDQKKKTKDKTEEYTVRQEWVKPIQDEMATTPDRDCFATRANARFPKFYTKEQDALKQEWDPQKVLWCNPPWSL